jgi:hypothetical protein
MSARKPKPSLPSLFDHPSKQLQLITVSVKPAKQLVYRRTWHEELPELGNLLLPRVHKGQLH